MARLTFKEPDKTLSGTFCGMIYKVLYGKQHIYSLPEPQLPKNPTPKQLRQYNRSLTVAECVAQIQKDEFARMKPGVDNMQLVADHYPAIKKAVERMYDDFYPVFFRSHGKLTGAIIYWYEFKRLPPELDLFTDRLPDPYREFCPRETGSNPTQVLITSVSNPVHIGV